VHYTIHAYDYAPIAGKGLPAARRYATLAPSAPHALHMPSHIFSTLGMWPEAIRSNLAADQANRDYAASTSAAAKAPKACDSAVRWGIAVIGTQTPIAKPTSEPMARPVMIHV